MSKTFPEINPLSPFARIFLIVMPTSMETQHNSDPKPYTDKMAPPMP
jgi:hypothetical protein